MFSYNDCLKRFAYLLKHDSHLGIDQEVSTAYCLSSSGDSVDLPLSGTISTTTVAIDWCITNLTHVWRVLIRLRSDKRSRKPFIHILWWTISFMTEWLLFGICMLCNRRFAHSGEPEKQQVETRLVYYVSCPFTPPAQYPKGLLTKMSSPTFSMAPNRVLQSSHPDGYFRYPASCAYFQSRIPAFI